MSNPKSGLSPGFHKLVAEDIKTSKQALSPYFRTQLDLSKPLLLALLAISLTTRGAIASVSLNNTARTGFSTREPGEIAKTQRIQVAQGFIGKCAIIGQDTFIYKRRNSNSQKIEVLSSGEQVRLAGNGDDGWIAIDEPSPGFVNISDLSDVQDCNGQSLPRQIPAGPTLRNQCRATKQAIYIYQQRSTASLRIRQLPANSQVILASNGNNGWIEISSPEPGFVQTNDLRNCDRLSSPIPPTISASELCRQVTYDGDEGLNIRQQPSTGAVVVNRAFLGNRVTLKTLTSFIDNDGREWLEITFPVVGWISNGFPLQGDINLQRCP